MIGLYIHIPFCRSKCYYCDFVSYPIIDENFQKKYLICLKKEIEIRQLNFKKISTIYFGGGTPSLLSYENLRFLFKIIFDNFDCHNVEEISVELNPDSTNEKKLLLMKDFNVNRLSFGLQSFNNYFLKILGRIHTVEQFIKLYELSKKINFKNINIDLICGIPKQTLENWKTDLKKILELLPQHISIYCLNIEEGTEFYNRKIYVDEDLTADMYEYTMDYLKLNNYKQYEISNFSLPGFECKHNQIYWKNKEYIGLGVSAVSYLNQERIKNVSDINKYINMVSNNIKPQETKEKLEGTEKSFERIFLGLRLLNNGLKLLPEEKIFEPKFKELQLLGLINNINDNFILTKKGIMLSNYVFRELKI